MKKANEGRQPYTKLEGTKLWKAIEKGIGDLVRNKDISELTQREYIVGYLCQLLTQRQLIG